jgi:hypothetical protein
MESSPIPDDSLKKPTTTPKKLKWTQSEDRTLTACVQQYGIGNWPTASQSLPGRTGKQCRDRWVNHLNPILNKEDWTSAEDEILISKQRLLGNAWSEISQWLPGRSLNSIKNRWSSLSNRSAKKDRPTPAQVPPVIPSGCSDLLRRFHQPPAKIDNFEIRGIGSGSIIEEED